MHPKDVYFLTPRTCKYGTLHGKGDFAAVTKDFAMGDYPGLSRRPSGITKVLIK